MAKGCSEQFADQFGTGHVGDIHGFLLHKKEKRERPTPRGRRFPLGRC
jgi:hypothetical protein